jgi:glycosyltransferase involved in cell wall biosynthesis
MAIPQFRSGNARVSMQAGNLAVLPPRRERLAIISTRDKLCGIAAYTTALERQLADLFDVTVFDLDQDLLRGHHPRVRRLGDAHIKEICGALTGFDAVNLQLEYGTLGRSTSEICRRFFWLIKAAPRLSVTFHTLKRPTALPQGDLLKALATFKFRTANDILTEYRRNRDLSLGIAYRLRRVARRKPVTVIVHNRRDLSEIKNLHGLDRAFDHPLVFLSSAEAQAVKNRSSPRHFPLLAPLSKDNILIGVFGFVNNYKGFETPIDALRYLPEPYHLLIFGGVHPNEILPQRTIHPYLAGLMQNVFVDTRSRPFSHIGKNNIYILKGTGDTLPRRGDLSGRIHFMGALDDADFQAGMSICDAVVFPYLEVGQSSSGPISLALELGCRIIASRTLAFLDFATYHPNRIEFFDIGNHLELAQHIAARPQHAQHAAPLYNSETNRAVYLAANSAAAEARPRFRRPGVGAIRQARNTVA